MHYNLKDLKWDTMLTQIIILDNTGYKITLDTKNFLKLGINLEPHELYLVSGKNQNLTGQN